MRHAHRKWIALGVVLVLGAGGAVRGVLGPILSNGPRDITLANRTVDRAVALARDFDGAIPVSGCAFKALKGRRYDVIINGTCPPSGESLAFGARAVDVEDHGAAARRRGGAARASPAIR